MINRKDFHSFQEYIDYKSAGGKFRDYSIRFVDMEDADAIRIIKDIPEENNVSFFFGESIKDVKTKDRANYIASQIDSEEVRNNILLAHNVRLSMMLNGPVYYPLSHVYQVNQFIDNYANDIKKMDLSLFEKVMAAYTTAVKSFEYGESFDPCDARNIYGMFAEDSAVCVGYVDFFNNLLEVTGIEGTPKWVSVKTEGEESRAHYQSVVRIDDDKYDIHGTYVFDPTQDSVTYFSLNKAMKKEERSLSPDTMFLGFFALTSTQANSYLNDKFYSNNEFREISDNQLLDAMYVINSNIFSSGYTEDSFVKSSFNTLLFRYMDINRKKMLQDEKDRLMDFVKGKASDLFSKEISIEQVENDNQNEATVISRDMTTAENISSLYSMSKDEIIQDDLGMMLNDVKKVENSDSIYNLTKDEIIQDDLSMMLNDNKISDSTYRLTRDDIIQDDLSRSSKTAF